MLGGPPDAPGRGCCCRGGFWPSPGGASSHSAERSPELNLWVVDRGTHWIVVSILIDQGE